jgi:hypothetical protein
MSDDMRGLKRMHGYSGGDGKKPTRTDTGGALACLGLMVALAMVCGTIVAVAYLVAS